MLKTSSLLISLFFSSLANSQTVEQAFKSAINNYNHKQYYMAIPIFNRVAYFATEPWLSKSYFILGNMYSETMQFELAKSYYDFCYTSTSSDSLKAEVLFRRVIIDIKETNLNAASSTLQLLKDTISYLNRIYFLNALISIQRNEYQKGRNTLISLFNPMDQLGIDSIDALIKKLISIKKKSPHKAKILSMLLPGLGQLYAHDYKNCTNSFFLNAGIITLGVLTYYNYTLFDALLFTLPWFVKYYSGGFHKAEYNLIHWQQSQTEHTFLQIINLAGRHIQ